MVDINSIAIYGGVAFFVLLIISGSIFFYFKFKTGKKFAFLLYSRDGKTVKSIFAKVKIDSENKSLKEFVFDTLVSPLEIREPTFWLNGKAFREITYTPSGDYCYIKNEGVDDKNYLLRSLTPEERQIAGARIKENQRRYENPMNKVQAYMMIGNFVLVLLLMIGIVYVTIAWGNNISDIGLLAKENSKTAQTSKVTADINQKVLEQATAILSFLTENANITRRVS